MMEHCPHDEVYYGKERPTMTVCENEHRAIEFNFSPCPLCAALERIRILSADVVVRNTEIAALKSDAETDQRVIRNQRAAVVEHGKEIGRLKTELAQAVAEKPEAATENDEPDLVYDENIDRENRLLEIEDRLDVLEEPTELSQAVAEKPEERTQWSDPDRLAAAEDHTRLVPPGNWFQAIEDRLAAAEDQLMNAAKAIDRNFDALAAHINLLRKHARKAERTNRRQWRRIKDGEAHNTGLAKALDELLDELLEMIKAAQSAPPDEGATIPEVAQPEKPAEPKADRRTQGERRRGGGRRVQVWDPEISWERRRNLENRRSWNDRRQFVVESPKAEPASEPSRVRFGKRFAALLANSPYGTAEAEFAQRQLWIPDHLNLIKRGEWVPDERNLHTMMYSIGYRPASVEYLELSALAEAARAETEPAPEADEGSSQLAAEKFRFLNAWQGDIGDGIRAFEAARAEAEKGE